MQIRTIYWNNNAVKLIDQTRLPGQLVYIECRTKENIWHAIKTMQIRGAPAIGIAAGFGVFLGIRDSKAETYVEFKNELDKVISYLFRARPTAVNLQWALSRMAEIAEKNSYNSIASIKDILFRESLHLLEKDQKICRKIGRVGSKFIQKGSSVLTHCNAGGLATAGYGTALGVLFRAKEERKNFSVYVDETRPLLQGARLTIWELMRAGITCTLICDNMAASLMKQGKIDLVIVGADRIASNGDTANKIGTYNLACLADIHNIPFYVAAPKSTFDLNIANGSAIPIEKRNPQEVTNIGEKMIAPLAVNVYNPAFDITPGEMITAFITEKGIIKPPYGNNIKLKFE